MPTVSRLCKRFESFARGLYDKRVGMMRVDKGRSCVAFLVQLSTPAPKSTTKSLPDDVAAMPPVCVVSGASQTPIILNGAATHAQPLGGLSKRVFDIVLAAVVLVLLAPITLMMTALIRFFVGGPILFAQRQVGFNGSVFVCYKFRTMPLDAELLQRRPLTSSISATEEWETHKSRNDPRANCLGRILREFQPG